MADVKERTPVQTTAVYDDDFHDWAFAQAELVRQRRLSELDLPNLVEELESMGSEQRFALESSYRLILSHLLKWAFQVDRRSRSWRNTIQRERTNAARRQKRNSSLARLGMALIDDVYPDARNEASDETGLPLSAFPSTCPYTLAQIRDREWFPGPEGGDLIVDAN